MTEEEAAAIMRRLAEFFGESPVALPAYEMEGAGDGGRGASSYVHFSRTGSPQDEQRRERIDTGYEADDDGEVGLRRFRGVVRAISERRGEGE